MDISKIDPNFRIEATNETDVHYYNYNESPIEIHGLYKPLETGKLWRMPEEYKYNEALNPGMRQLLHNTVGGRLRFATDSPYLSVMVEVTEMTPSVLLPVSGLSGLDIYTAKRGESDFQYIKTVVPPQFQEDKDRFFSSSVYFSIFDNYDQHEVMINLPQFNGVNKICVGIKEGCSLFAPAPYKYEKPVLFYGDSITHGGNATRPGNNYPNHISRWLNCDFINLGFTGNAMGELEVADFIGSLELSAIVTNLELRNFDIEEFRSKHYPFYARLRKHQPDTPILIMSRAGFPRLRKYQPKQRDFVLTNRIIMETCTRAWAEGDENLYYLDGAGMFGDEDQDACTVDHTHPNDLGFYRMAQHIRPILYNILEGIK